MTEMVYVDVEHGPRPDQLFDAARQSNGRPGEFLAGSALGADRARRVVVHGPRECAAVRRATQGRRSSVPLPPARSIPERCTGSPERARGAGARGSSRAAGRLLPSRPAGPDRSEVSRATAAACALQLGWLAVERAQLTEAVGCFGRARELLAHVPHRRPGRHRHRRQRGPTKADWSEAEGALRTAALAAARSRIRPSPPAPMPALPAACCGRGATTRRRPWLRAAPTAQVAPRELARTGVALARVLLAEGAITSATHCARKRSNDARQSGRRIRQCRGVPGAGTRRCRSRGMRYPRQSMSRMAFVLRAGPPAPARCPPSAGPLEIASGADPSAGRRPRGRPARRVLDPLAAAASLRGTRGAIASRGRRPRRGHPGLHRGERRRRARAGAVVRTGPIRSPSSNGFSRCRKRQRTTSAAIGRVADHLRTRLRAATVIVIGPEPERRVIVSCGRPWQGDPSVAWRAIAAGVTCIDRPIARAVPGGRTAPLQRRDHRQHCRPLDAGVDARSGTRRCAAARGRARDCAERPRRARSPRSGRCRTPPGRRDPGRERTGEVDARSRSHARRARRFRSSSKARVEAERSSSHARSIGSAPRRDRRFCAINCAALSDELLEAELFGMRAAPLPAPSANAPGLFEEADGGTLFLDEIGELSARAQAKLLRVLQDGQVRRVGENMSRRVDVRDRRGDEPPPRGGSRRRPVSHRPAVSPRCRPHRRSTAARSGRRCAAARGLILDRGGGRDGFARHPLPGSARRPRALRLARQRPRAAERDCVDGGPLAASADASLPRRFRRTWHRPRPLTGSSFEVARSEFERRFLKAALASAGGHRARAAKTLGITRQGLAKMLRRLSLDTERPYGMARWPRMTSA